MSFAAIILCTLIKNAFQKSFLIKSTCCLYVCMALRQQVVVINVTGPSKF